MGAGAKLGKLKLGLLLCVVGAMFALPSTASAEFTFCPPGSSAGQCVLIANELSVQATPAGVATDFETGRVYVGDREGNRVDVFKTNGEFLFAFGWGVDTGASKLETCTTASTCQAGIAGAGAGQFSRPDRIAVDNAEGSASRHDVYVGTDNFRVQKFNPDGSFELAFGWGVDTGAEKPEVCTAESSCQAGYDALQKGGNGGRGECQIARRDAPIAVGPGGNVFLADNQERQFEAEAWTDRVEKFSSGGVCLGETALFKTPAGIPGQSHALSMYGLAVDSGEDAYIIQSGYEGAFVKYDLGTPETVLCVGDTDVNTSTLAIDSEGRLFASQVDGRVKGVAVDNHVITEYDSACHPVHRFAYGAAESNLRGLAAYHSPEGDLFAAGWPENPKTEDWVKYVKIPPPGPIVAALGVKASSVGNAKATIRAEINPEGKATEVHVDYLTEEDFEDQGGFEGPATKSTETVPLNVPEGREFRVNQIEPLVGCPTATKQLIEEGKCLTPETEYRYRIVAANADNPSGKGEGSVSGAFTTRAPLGIESAWATEVGPDAAVLHTLVNPFGIPATGYFEYVDEASYEASGFAEALKAPAVEAEPPQAPIDFGSGEAAVARSVILYPLQPATTYHYRLAGTDPLIDAPLHNGEKTFRTFGVPEGGGCPDNEAFRGGASALLPDCRAYEMVSPPDKAGGDIVLTTNTFALSQSAVSGERLAYPSYRAFGDAKASPWTSHYIAARDPEAGWASHAINPVENSGLIREAVTFEAEFKVFSDDLCQGWLEPKAEPMLAEGAIATYPNLYSRTDPLCGEESFEALTTAKPEGVLPFKYWVELQGLSADGSVAAIAAEASLDGSGAPLQPSCAPDGGGCGPQLYARAPGQGMRFVCVLPSGEAYVEDCSAGTNHGAIPQIGFGETANLANAISADGRRIFWTASLAEGRIYLRENPLEDESARVLGEAKGTGDLIGPATCTGNLVTKSTTINKAKCSSGSLAVGQEISALEGIAAGTTITKVEEVEAGVFKLTLNKAATLLKSGAEFSGIASAIVSNAVAETGAFAVGQELIASKGGIADGATITKVEEPKAGVFKLTLSAKATATATATPLRATSACSEADKACTVNVSRAGENAVGPGSKSRFLAAADDGSRALFTTRASETLPNTLYEYEVDTGTTKAIAGKVGGLLGASEDATRVYFTSTEALTGEEANGEGDKAVAGKPNLYFHEVGPGAGSYRFLGTLGSEDANPGPRPFSSNTAVAYEPKWHSGRVSPDGLHAAFMATTRLTGYDNTDAASGEADTEVFLYDAEAGEGAGELRCASCNPSGGRPAGVNLYFSHPATNPFWVAGRIPTYETSLYASRVLADDGSRLFFESQDSLVPRDTNGHLDVYEWEELGTGSCDEGDVTYSSDAEGCIDLISSGRSLSDSAFVDASQTGDDVFFTTLASLLPQDDGLIDVYDARAGGGFPEAAPAPAECEGEACQGTPEAPNDPTPASATFEGAGNVHEEAVPLAPKPCAKGKVKRHGKCVAKKHKKAARRAKHKRRAGR